MYDDISTNLAIIERKLSSQSPDDLLELQNLFAITDHLLKLEANSPLFHRYTQLKESFFIRSKKLNTEDEQYHSYDDKDAIQILKYNKMLEIDDKVDEIVELNDYMDCIVKNQGHQIDSILEQMHVEEERTAGIVREMRKTHRKYGRRNKIVRCLFIIAFGVIGVYTIKVIVTVIVNKIV